MANIGFARNLSQIFESLLHIFSSESNNSLRADAKRITWFAASHFAPDRSCSFAVSDFISNSVETAHTAVIYTTVHKYCSSQFWAEQLCGLKISIDTLCGRWFEQHTADPALQNVGLIESSTAWDIVSKLRSAFSY